MISFPVKLACPVDGLQLDEARDGSLVCSHGHSFPVVQGIPVLLRDDVEQTIGIASASLARARGKALSRTETHPELFLDTIGVTEDERDIARTLADSVSEIDPVVAVLISATNGIAYKHLIGRLSRYPIPEIRLPEARGKILLDIGCSWGRWSIAVARKGYRPVGIDPSLGALMAAQRLARQSGLEAYFVCADARYLPFADGSFDNVFSYSVIQHFSKPDAKRTIQEISRVTHSKGDVLVQMPNRNGLRSQTHLALRGYSEGAGFDVRYWTPAELEKLFSQCVGPTDISVHCFFGLGLEPSDTDLMRPSMKKAVFVSEMLRRFSQKAPLLTQIADSVYVRAKKAA